MEAFSTYEPWHDKNSHKTFLRSTQGKCLHYYFHFIDDVVGLCYLRVSTWYPFLLQFYCNGHSWLENRSNFPLRRYSEIALRKNFPAGCHLRQSRICIFISVQENHTLIGPVYSKTESRGNTHTSYRCHSHRSCTAHRIAVVRYGQQLTPVKSL